MRTLIKFLKNNGFSLVEIMIALGVSAGVAVLAAKLLSDQQFNQNHLKMMSDIDKHQAIIQSTIKKPDVCNATFAGVTLPTGSSAEISVPQVIPATAADFRVLSMELRNPLPSSRYASMRDKVKELVVTYELNRPYFSNPLVQKSTHLFMTMDAAGLFKECGSILEDTKTESLQKMCEALGSVNAEWLTPVDYPTMYTGALSQTDLLAQYPNGKCQLKDVRCPLGQAPFKIDSLGGLKCHPISSRFVDLGVKVDSIPNNCVGSDSIQIIESGGKFTLLCSPSGGGGPGGCTSDCSNAPNVCTGTTFSDGCGGLCNGTKTGPGCMIVTPPSCPADADCSDSSNVCSGDTFVDPVCGTTCNGTKNCGPTCWSNCFAAGYDCVYGGDPAAILPHGVAIKKCPDTSPTYLYCGDTPHPEAEVLSMCLSP